MNKNPTVKEIVEQWLRDNGYDGLYVADDGCGCTLDDFRPCSEMNGECQAGHVVGYEDGRPLVGSKVVNDD